MTTATISTDLGDIVVELYDESAPKAAANFAKLATSGYYDDVIFHRVIPGFVIQPATASSARRPASTPAGSGQAGRATPSRTRRSRAITCGAPWPWPMPDPIPMARSSSSAWPT